MTVNGELGHFSALGPSDLLAWIEIGGLMDHVPGTVHWSIKGAVTAVALLLCGLLDPAWSVPFREGDEVFVETLVDDAGANLFVTVGYGQPEVVCGTFFLLCHDNPLLEQIDIEAKTITFSLREGVVEFPLGYQISNRNWPDRDELIDSVTLSSTSNILNLDDSDLSFYKSSFGCCARIDFTFSVIGEGGGSATLTFSTVAPVPLAPLPVVLAGFLLVLAARHLLRGDNTEL